MLGLKWPVALMLVKVIPPVGTPPVTVAVQVVEESTGTGLEQVTVTVGVLT